MLVYAATSEHKHYGYTQVHIHEHEHTHIIVHSYVSAYTALKHLHISAITT